MNKLISIQKKNMIIMNTQVFRSYEEFLRRPDKSVNGVSRQFVEKHPKHAGVNNTGCWNCIRCMDCRNCENCNECIQSNECEFCKFGYLCVDCFQCYSCFRCEHCYKSNECSFCSFGDNLTGRHGVHIIIGASN